MPSEATKDGGWGWVIVACSFANHFLLEGFVRSFGLFYVMIVERYDSDAFTTTWLHATFMAIQQMLIGPFLGYLIDKLTSRWLVIAGGAFLFVSYLSSAYAQNLATMFLTYSIIGGIGSGLVYSPIVIIVNDYFEEKRGKAMGLAASGSGIGTFVMPPLIVILFHTYGYSGGLMVMAAIVLNHSVYGGLYRPNVSGIPQPSTANEEGINVKNYEDTDKDVDSNDGQDSLALLEQTETAHHKPEDELKVKVPNVNEESLSDSTKLTNNVRMKHLQNITGSRSSLYSLQVSAVDVLPFKHHDSCNLQTTELNVSKGDDKSTENKCCTQSSNCFRKASILRHPAFLMYCFLLFTIPSSVTATFVFLPGLAKECGVSETKAAVLISVIGASSIAGNLIIGVLFDVPFINRHRRLFHAVLGSLLGTTVVLMVTISTFPLLAVNAAIYGFLLAGVMGQRATALSQYVSEDELPHAFGFMIVFQGLGNLVGVSLQGHLKDHFGTYSACFVYGGCMVCLSSVILILEYVITQLKTSRQDKDIPSHGYAMDNNSELDGKHV